VRRVAPSGAAVEKCGTFKLTKEDVYKIWINGTRYPAVLVAQRKGNQLSSGNRKLPCTNRTSCSQKLRRFMLQKSIRQRGFAQSSDFFGGGMWTAPSIGGGAGGAGGAGGIVIFSVYSGGRLRENEGASEMSHPTGTPS